MKALDKEIKMISKTNFFTNDEVLFIGLSSNPKSFSRSVYRDFLKVGIDVYPLGMKSFSIDEDNIYNSIEDLPKVPSCAYILLNKENTKIAVNNIKGKGVKKILFHSSSTVDPMTLEECRQLGIETVVACPKMMISKAPIHKIHGFIAGVRK